MNLQQSINLYCNTERSIAVDLDGTLAYYDGDISKIGEPIPKMLARVKAWIADGEQVKIFTARAGDPVQVQMIGRWLEDNGLGGLKITNVKDKGMIEMWDDRAISVVPNTGEVE